MPITNLNSSSQNKVQLQNESQLPCEDQIKLEAERIKLFLSEKRTTLSVMRTGIAVIMLPMSVITVLLATSKYYDFFGNSHLTIPLVVICVGLFLLGSYLIQRSVFKFWKLDRMIDHLKKNDPIIKKFYEENP